MVCLIAAAAAKSVEVTWPELGYPEHLSAKVHDLWEHKDAGEFTGSFQATVPAHGVVMITIRP